MARHNSYNQMLFHLWYKDGV